MGTEEHEEEEEGCDGRGSGAEYSRKLRFSRWTAVELSCAAMCIVVISSILVRDWVSHRDNVTFSTDTVELSAEGLVLAELFCADPSVKGVTRIS